MPPICTNTTQNRTQEEVATKIFYEVFIPLVTFLGIVGNFLNLLVLTRKQLTSRLNQLERNANRGLACLALSDMLFCLVLFPYSIINVKLVSSNWFEMLYRAYGVGSINTLMTVSTFQVMVMALQRYVVVVHPLDARDLLRGRRPTIFLIIAWIVAIFISIPYFILNKLEVCQQSNSTYFKLEKTFNDNATKHLRFYLLRILPVFATFVPLVVLSVCNVRLVLALHKASKERRVTSTSRKSKKSNSNILTLTLIIIVAMAIFLVIPAEIVRYFDFENFTPSGRIVIAILNVSQASNFAFNFVLYVAVSSDFRNTIKSLFKCGKVGEENPEMQLMLNANGRTAITVTE